jgi:hypothetical protein
MLDLPIWIRIRIETNADPQIGYKKKLAKTMPRR